MSIENSAAKQLDKWEAKGNQCLTPAIKSILKTHSFVGVAVWLLPFFGIESIFYAFVLWHMYVALAKEVNVKFSATTIVKGMIVNVLVCIVANVFFDIIAALGLGFIFSALVGYFLTYSSGKSFLGSISKK